MGGAVLVSSRPNRKSAEEVENHLKISYRDKG